MKPFQKVLAALLAVIFVFSMVSCVPVSLSKDWCYKYGDTKYDIGVYIYSLYNAYNSAEQYAQKAKGYKEGESFLDLEITDDDGNKAKARDWILKKADETARELVALDKLIKEKGATWDEATMESAQDAAKDIWDMGANAAYGYYDPMSQTLEPYGVSFESFAKVCVSQSANTPYTIKYGALFDAYYSKGGSDEVSDKDLLEFFLKSYFDYSYIPVKLYESTTDDDGNSTNKAFSDKKTKTIQEALKGFVEELNNGSADFSDIAAKCEKKYSVTSEEEVKNRVQLISELKSQDEEVYKIVNKLKNGKAELYTKDADGDAPTAYIIVKNDISKNTEDYVTGAYRATTLQSMKSDDFKDMLKKAADALKKDKNYDKNDGAIDRYDPDLFYEKPEETTAAAEDSAA